MAVKQHIIIKGVKDGLIFLLDDQCDFEDIIQELKHKLEKTHQQLLSGPLIHITVKSGQRVLTEEQTKQFTDIVRSQGNLMIQAIESEAAPQKLRAHAQMKIMSCIVRSGQEIEYDGDLLLLGDVHPGGIVRCTGDIYVMGSLKGAAHAGMDGRRDAIIVASLLKPTALKIADIISQSVNNDSETSDGLMEYGYIDNEQICIQKLTLLHHENRIPVIMRGV